MHYLLLFLEGTLQAWGANSRFDLRETLPYPTKSGIYGLLLAASGDSGPQIDLLERMSLCNLTVFAFRSANEILHDFQMVGNAYREKDPWETLNIPRKSDGTKAVGGGAKLTHRYYLQDASFAALLSLPDDLAEKFSAALLNPVYDLYLGRKCCVPSEMIFQGCFQSIQEAQTKIKTMAQKKNLTPSVMIREALGTEPDVRLINDVPLEFGIHRRYRDRWIIETPYTMEML